MDIGRSSARCLGRSGKNSYGLPTTTHERELGWLSGHTKAALSLLAKGTGKLSLDQTPTGGEVRTLGR
jgi:hypothetical protein